MVIIRCPSGGADEIFADDLVVKPGRASSRVALWLRAAERKPAASLIENGIPHTEYQYCLRF